MNVPKSLARLELDSLLSVAHEHSYRDYLMLLVTFNHGLRVSETLALTVANLVDGFIVVQRLKKSHKTTQPLLPNEVEGLLALANSEGRLFPIHRQTFWRRMQQYGAEAGIPAFKRHPHVLKHTCGRLGHKAGMSIPEVQTYLGHVNGGNTMVYMQAGEEEAASAFAAALTLPTATQKTFAAVAGA
jgi:type 1 fimbriae regulatory protein FimB